MRRKQASVATEDLAKEKAILSNVNIREAIASGQLAIENLQDEAIQPASIDLHLGNQFISVAPWAREGSGYNFILDPFSEESMAFAFTAPETTDRYRLLPGEFVLAATERVTIGSELSGQVAGKSSVARFGLIVESAGLVDSGFDGPITLELFNQAPFSIWLTPGMSICQLSLSRLDSPANPVYSGSYVGSTGPVVSKYWKSNKRPE